MTRRLSSEEREIWDRLRRSVRPLRRRGGREAEPEPAAPIAEADPPKPAVVSAAARATKRKPPEQPPAVLEERVRRRLSRGLAEVDARIDLHGMRQERAFSALAHFLRQSQMRGDRLVLVITGKGRFGEDGSASQGRGVLRLSVPAWLVRPDFRDLVAGFEEAGRRHGGAGALYVRLRRRLDVHNRGES